MAGAGLPEAAQVLLRPEGVLYPLAALLGPLETWSLRSLSSGVGGDRGAICPGELVKLRTAWCEGSGERACEEPLCDLVRAVDPQGPPEALHKLLRTGGLQLLLDPEAALMPNAAGQTALTWAADYGLDALVRLLVGPLAAASAGSTALLASALQASEANGWYPLFRAAWSGRVACARLLLQARANPEGHESGRYSPLMSAARWGHTQVVEELLAAGAAPQRQNRFGEDALMLAKGQGHDATARLLRAEMATSGADANAPAADEHAEWRSSRRARHTLGDGWAFLGDDDFYLKG